MDLSDYHREQLSKYVCFFRNKREVQVAEIKELFNDAADELQTDALLNYDEMSNILSTLGDSVQSNFTEDLKRTVNMSVLAIQQLLADADAQDLELQMDTSKIEDSHLIEEIERMKLDASSNAGKAKKTGRLVSLRDEQQRIIGDNASLEAQLEKLREENQKLHDTNDKSKQSISNLTYEVESLKRHKSSDKEEKTSGSKVLDVQKELDEERDALVSLRAELADARDIILGKLGCDLEEITKNFKKSNQYSQLRKTLGQKTDQLTDLRR